MREEEELVLLASSGKAQAGEQTMADGSFPRRLGEEE